MLSGEPGLCGNEDNRAALAGCDRVSRQIQQRSRLGRGRNGAAIFFSDCDHLLDQFHVGGCSRAGIGFKSHLDMTATLDGLLRNGIAKLTY